MKKAVVPVMLAAVLVTGLVFSGCDVVGTVGGGNSGNVVTQQKDFTDFTSVNVGSAFKVNITKSDTFSVSVSADEDLIDYVEVTKSGQELTITLHPRHIFTDFTLGTRTLKAEITMPALYGLQLSGASQGTVTGFKSSHNFNLNVSGASSLKIIDGEAGNADVYVSGASKVSGNMTITDATMEISGASSVELSGSADSLVLGMSGASKVKMDSFSLRDADVNLSGASDATLNVKDKLDAELSGASSLYFYGNPDMGTLNVTGASTIKHE